MKTHTTITTTFTIPGTEIEVELPFEPDGVMGYKEPLVKITDDKIVLGYLAHDPHCANPLEDCDGMGYIYEARRHGSTLRDYEEALGLADGGPDLGLVDEAEVVKEAHSRLRELAESANASATATFADALEACRLEGYEQHEGESEADYVCRYLDTLDELAPVINVEGIAEELWREGRKNGTIGNPYAVLLDVYEHSGVAYSLSGQGMQCQWDTARAGAVWVPDDVCVDRIKWRAEVYRKGEINELRDGTFEVKTLRGDLLGYDDTVRPHFQHWHEAYKLLEQLEPPHRRDITTAEHIAARELAKQAAETYTDWCNGNCYGVVVVTYDKGSWTDGCSTAEILNEDACWGFVGDDHAYESLKNDYFPKD